MKRPLRTLLRDLKEAYKKWSYQNKILKNPDYHNGHEDGYKKALKSYPAELDRLERMSHYYYSHINNCLKTKCKCLEE